MGRNLLYSSRSKLWIIILSIIGILLLAGVGYWGGKKLFKKEDEAFFKVLLIFVDENSNFVEGVDIVSNGEIVYTTKSDGKYEGKYVKKGTVLTFQIDGYQVQTDSITVEKNIHLQQINLISYIHLKQKTFTIKIIDINGLPIKNVNAYEEKALIGTTDSLGEIKVPIYDGSKNISFKVSGDYFSIPNITIDYNDDSSSAYTLRADFLLDKYTHYTDSNGETHTRNFTVGYNFRTPDGRRLNNVKINYKIKDTNTFKIGVGYSIVFENQIFESAFAYVYDELNSIWLCSPILKTSPIGGDIFMEEAIYIKANVNTERSSIYTSNGYYFLSNNDKIIEIVIPSYENIKFYKEMEYNIPKYELILVNEDMTPILSVDKSITGVKFVLK